MENIENAVSDGQCLYVDDFTKLVGIAQSQETYTVDERCKVIASGAFEGNEEVDRVFLPEGVETIEDNAFARCSITRMDIPASVKTIGYRAFYGCWKLIELHLLAGLEEIGEEAFAFSALGVASMPSTLKKLGYRAFADCPISYSGRNRTYRIALTNPYLKCDARGGVYAKSDEGDTFMELVEHDIRMYNIVGNTVEIGPHAFEGLPYIVRINLPESVRKISSRAFANCPSLVRVDLPANATDVAPDAFAETQIAL